MSFVNNQNQYSQVDNQIFGEYKFSDSTFINENGNQAFNKTLLRNNMLPMSSSYKETYSIPLSFVKDQVFTAKKVILDTISDIEKSMRKLYIDPNVNYELLLAHQDLWNQLNKNIKIKNPELIEFYASRLTSNITEQSSYTDQSIVNESEQTENTILEQSNMQDEEISESEIKKILSEISPEEVVDNENILDVQPYPSTTQKQNFYKIPGPNYICYDQLVFAEKLNTTASRKFLEEFYEIIAHSSFSYIYKLRRLLSYLSKEIINIEKSLNTDFGEDYENELQQKIAVHYDSWSKTAIHYTNRIAKILLSKSEGIPSAELDQISKEQATKFQAFFAIKLNAVNSEIEDILASIKRDLHDNSEIFYDRYLSPALKFSSEISDPLDMDYETTPLGKRTPFLSEQILIASVMFKGNFTSVLADFIDRQNIVIGKVDAMLRLIHEKRKYSDYITQLSVKGIEKPKVWLVISDDKYSAIFQKAVVSQTRNDINISSHGLLDGLDEDHHPQYLLKDNGTITGNIYVDENVTIDGVDLNTHAHTGTDGSSKISSLDIDYSEARSEEYSKQIVKVPINIAISNFSVDIVNKIPRCTAVINIEVDDDTIDTHEYEIIYTEVK